MSKDKQEKLEDLLMANMDIMYRMAYSILENDADAQDAVGETIVTAFEKWHQLRKPSSAKAWLMQILVNKSKTMKTKGYRTRLYADVKDPKADATFAYDEVWPVVMELKEEYREVIVLYYYEQFSVKEIAKTLNIPAGTIKSRLARARERLAKEIER